MERVMTSDMVRTAIANGYRFYPVATTKAPNDAAKVTIDGTLYYVWGKLPDKGEIN